MLQHGASFPALRCFADAMLKVSAVADITRSPISALFSRRRGVVCAVSLLAVCLFTLIAGCSKIRQLRAERHEMVYVWVRQMYLRDRVAAVSNHVGEVTNGQPLQVIEHARRFLRVKTDKGEIGWIPERAVIDAKTYDIFTQLGTQHKDAPVLSNGTLRDEVYLHAAPGRDTDRFYILPGNQKVQMLVRASVKREQKNAPAAPAPQPGAAPVPPPMEDWWLIRDQQNHVGWVLANRVDVDVPDDVAQYAEGKKIVGAYILTKVHDDEAQTPDHNVAEYVTALADPKSGLPYDFDQIRVFTWNVKKHRYETAFRLRDIKGYLPLHLATQPGSNGGTDYLFSFTLSSSADVGIDPNTGVGKPINPRTIAYALRDTTVRRIGPDLGPLPDTRSPEEKAAAAAKAKAKAQAQAARHKK